MSDRYDIAVKQWAAAKLGIDDWQQIASVAIETDAGWGGTDITAGDPAEATVTAHLVDGSSRQVLNLIAEEMYGKTTFDFVELLTEILGADTPATKEAVRDAD